MTGLTILTRMKTRTKEASMYENVKYLGHTLKQWRDEVFNGTYSIGELYQMVKDGVDISKICPSNKVNKMLEI